MEYFIEILKAIVFGIVEGITEWLPVSSTGHMIILNQFFGYSETQGQDFLDFFLVIIQLGAILAVVISFFKELWPFGSKLSHKKKKQIWETWLKILIASVPAGVVGLLFDDWFDEHLYNYLTVSITLIVYGLVFLGIETFLYFKGQRIKQRYHLNRSSYEFNQSNNDQKHKYDVSETELTNYPLFDIHSVKEMSMTYALIIGVAQMLALIPGTSRSGITICAALLLSIDRRTAAKFSFYMSIPAMLGGTVIKALLYGVKVYKGTAVGLTGFQFVLILIAMAVAFGISFLVIRFFMKMLRTKSFISFGIYRIALGIVLLIIFFVVNKGDFSAGVEMTSSVAQILPSVPVSTMTSAIGILKL